MKHYTLATISEELGIETQVILHWVKIKLITPLDYENLVFDLEDLERMRLMAQLQEEHSLNHEALEIILHLIDQIHFYQEEIKTLKKNRK